MLVLYIPLMANPYSILTQILTQSLRMLNDLLYSSSRMSSFASKFISYHNVCLPLSGLTPTQAKCNNIPGQYCLRAFGTVPLVHPGPRERNRSEIHLKESAIIQYINDISIFSLSIETSDQEQLKCLFPWDSGLQSLRQRYKSQSSGLNIREYIINPGSRRYLSNKKQAIWGPSNSNTNISIPFGHVKIL